MNWDIFCRVVDNYGDIGVCWRLCANLASRGEQARLWLDDARALAWMAPGGAAGVAVHRWSDASAAAPGHVVVGAFGCHLPDAFVQRMAHATEPPVWINLEYLSAEAYVERSHRLPSPQLRGPGTGLKKWFFYPGFTSATGGLIREPDLQQRQAAFDRDAWLRQQGIERRPGERLVSLFAYDLPQDGPHPGPLPLMRERESISTLLLLAASTPAPEALPSNVRLHRLPFLSQNDYDHLLWSCDLNFVRGEDSFVRAQWAGKPFVWQIYPQDDGAHAAKLNAFVDRFPEVDGLRSLWHGWNGLAAMPGTLPAASAWERACAAWRESLASQPDLVTQLIQFAARPG